jgi:hypothetical protein
VVPTDVAQSVVEVEPFLLPASAETEVGGEPTAASGMIDATGRWGEEGTPPCTSAGHCGVELPRPSSCFPCERESYHP